MNDKDKKIKELEEEKDEYLRKAVNAEIAKIEKENEWLRATIIGIIKEGHIATRAVAYQVKHKFKIDDKEFEK